MHIYTVTPNPALDLSGHVSKVVCNEKNYVYRTRTDPGGNAINAARIAKRLGADPILLGFLGGPAGEQLGDLLKMEGLKQRFTPIEGATRTNVTITNDSDHKQTRLTFPGPSIRDTEIKALLKTIRSLDLPGILILGGSPPNQCPPDFYVQIICAATTRGLEVIVDVPATSLKFIFDAHQSKKLPKLLLIKPNLAELESFRGKKIKTDLEIAREACKLLSFSQIVCVSLGKRGVIFAWNDLAWFVRSPKVHPRGTVGAGDSMVGAIASKFADENTSVLEAVLWGVAAGAATATTEGTSLGKASLIRRLYPQCTIQQILGEKPEEPESNFFGWGRNGDRIKTSAQRRKQEGAHRLRSLSRHKRRTTSQLAATSHQSNRD